MTPIAIVQLQPDHSSLQNSLQIALSAIEEAANNGAKLVVFGECWLCGYPAWIDYATNLAKWDHEPSKAAWANIYQNAVEASGPEIEILCKRAAEHHINVVIGANEVIKNGKGNGTLYNAIFTIDEHGYLRNHHRKLMPTYNEKLIHGTGDGHGLEAVETSIGRIGSLICWEHWMPLTRQAMHDSSEDIHIALWPGMAERHMIASRHYAFEGRCYVIAVAQMMNKSALPEEIELADDAAQKDWLLNGGSCIFGPNAEVLLEPQYDKTEIIYFDLPDNDLLVKERMNLSVSGHYQRPDVFELSINKNRLS